MRRITTVAALAAAAALPAGVAVATTPPDTAPPEEPGVTSLPAGTVATQEGIGEASPVYDDEGNLIASFSVLDVVPGWTDYSEGDEPDEGNEYVRVTVSIRSEMTSDDTFGVSVDDFILQSNRGFITTAENIRTAAEAEADEEPVGDAELTGGESAELNLTFQVDADAGPQSVFYRPEDDQLVDVAEVA